MQEIASRVRGLPAPLAEVISYHHRRDPEKAHARLAAIARVADTLCVTRGIGLGMEGICCRTDPRAVAALGLTEAQLQEAMAQMASRPIAE